MNRIAFVAAMLAISAACGSAPVKSGSPGAGKRSVLIAEEMEAAKGVGWTAYDLISLLRPEFLRSRGAMSLSDAVPVTAKVYLDSIFFGNLQSLKTLSAGQIVRIEYINAADATTRFGTGNAGGAILIMTR
ncbi:MAG: hypothetical protein Q7S20_02255 [Gemmatimonadaceae bacterium]|nr:hypothetical protein [Gemmatimonadaceae bacterium]